VIEGIDLPARTYSVVIEVIRQTFEDAPGLVAVLTGAEHRIEYLNAAASALFPRRNIIGLPLVAVPGLVGQNFGEILDDVCHTGRPFREDAVPILLGGAEGIAATRYFDVLFQPIFTPGGEVSGILNQSNEVTTRVLAEAALRQSEARFGDILSQTTVGVAQADMDGFFVLVNERYCEILGRTRDELERLRVQDVTHPDDVPRNIQMFRALAEGGPPFVIEKRYVRPDGTARWVRNNVSLVRDTQGHPEFITAISVDITAEKGAQLELARQAERQSLLVHELNHRVKNTLTTVQALAAQIVRDPSDPEQGYQAFIGRLMALAKAHDVLTREQWIEADLLDVVAGAVSPFQGDRTRIMTEGPSLAISPGQVLALSMALHELGTNATKYGALSSAGGRVSVTWATDDGLVVTWVEAGGPPVQRPTRRGFGSRLLERALTNQLGGSVNLAFEPSGVKCIIRAPLGAAAGPA
jgi:PAS domain S-box-containing protein